MTETSSERLLVLAPTGRDAELALGVLAGAHLTAIACGTVAEVCREIARGAGAVLFEEEALTVASTHELATAIAEQEPWSDLPVVVFTSRGELAHRAGAPGPLDALGNVTVVERPLRRVTLVSVARAALRARRRQYATRELLARVQAAVRQRDEFLALLGHELRNPLAAIEMASRLVQRGADAARHMTIVRRQTRQLARLVDDLLDISRITSGKVALRTGPVDLRRLAERCVESQATAAAERAGVELSCAAEEGPIFTIGDETRLDQVLSNLVSNAIKYTPRGGHVHVAVERRDGAAVLRVTDDGIGIAPEHLVGIFEPFVQVEAALHRAHGGMGLGLTLVRNLVRMHAGSVDVRSEGLGRGSEFVVRLPLSRAPSAARVRPPRRTVAPRDVLVVEDNDDVRAAFVAVLELAGHRVRGAPNGQIALRLVRERPPEVAFVDIGLPLMDGFELGRRLRAELGRQTLLVALTGYGRPEDREASRQAGFDLHLTKPVDPDHLDEIAHGAVGSGA